MLTPEVPIALADLAAAGVALRPSDAVTIVRELLLQVQRGEIPGVPSAHVVRLSASGTVSVEGPVAADGANVPRAAQLLDTLLPAFDAVAAERVPGALRLVVARALGTLDLPPYPSIESFIDALERFAKGDPQATIRDITSTYESAIAATRQPRTLLTVSDIRRARRATGLTLAQVAERSRIPETLLRQLEWGYLRNWPTGHYGRTELVRYARAAGLDESVVVSVVHPMIEEVRTSTALSTTSASVPVVVATIEPDAAPEPAALARIDAPAALLRSFDAPDSPRRSRLGLAIAVAAALLLVALLPAAWHAVQGPDTIVQNSEVAPQPTASREPAVNREPPAPAAAAPAQPAVHREPAVAPLPDPSLQPRTRPVLTQSDAEMYSPTFASVGTAMFYHAEEDGQSALMRADTNGAGAILRITRIVDDNARNFHVRPSPDGNLIAFDSDRDGERSVYVANADGTGVRRLTEGPFSAVPSWSPDGRTLAFVRAEPDRPRVWNLWTVDVESGKTTRVTEHRVGQPWGGSWFPDGRRIAYSHEDRLIVRHLDSGAERIYPSPKKGHLVRTPAVAPDGRRLIFQVHRDGAWILDLRDGSMRKVLGDPSAEEYTWAPDGRRVAYHSRRSGTWGVWVMSAQ